MLVLFAIATGVVIVFAAVSYWRTIDRLRKDDQCLQRQIDELRGEMLP